jgi:hypothetical protein
LLLRQFKVLTMLNPWISFGLKAWQIGLEAQSVIALRMLRLAAGGARAEVEAGRMVTEKILAAGEAQMAAAMAAMRGHKEHVIAGKALNVYGKRVRANRRKRSRDHPSLERFALLYPLSGRVSPERLVGPSVTFFNMPLIAREAVKGTNIRQAIVTRRSAKKLHRSRTVMAARSFGQGPGIVHETISGVSPLCWT